MTSSKLLTLQFVVPYTKEEITNAELKQASYTNFISAILLCLPKEHLQSMTCIKSIVSKPVRPEKKLECVKIIGPNSLQNEFEALISHGIPYKERRIYPLRDGEAVSNAFPKLFTIKFRQLPHFLEDKEIIEAAKLSNYKLSKLRHQKEQISPEFEMYNGVCYADVQVSNMEELEQLKSWNQSTLTSKFLIEEMNFKCQIQSLFECDFCKDKNLNSLGHHVRQCKEKRRQPNPQDNNEDASTSTAHNPTEEDKDEVNYNPNLTFYLDEKQQKIFTIKEIDEKRPGFSSHPPIKKLQTVNIVDDAGNKVNRMIHVVKLNRDEQKQLFEKYNWQIEHGGTIKDFDSFENRRKKLDVYLDTNSQNGSLYLVNLFQSVFLTVKKLL